MTRGLAGATQTASEAAAIAPITLVKLVFDSGNVLLHTGIGDFVYNGETYTGAGDLGFIGPIDEDADLTRNTMEIGLRGVPNDIIAIALLEDYQGNACTIYHGYLNLTTMALVGEPAVFTGKMDYPEISLGATGEIRLIVEDEFATLDKPKVRRYNNEDQRSRYVSDKGLEFVEQATELQIFWGQKSL